MGRAVEGMQVGAVDLKVRDWASLQEETSGHKKAPGGGRNREVRAMPPGRGAQLAHAS